MNACLQNLGSTLNIHKNPFSIRALQEPGEARNAPGAGQGLSHPQLETGQLGAPGQPQPQAHPWGWGRPGWDMGLARQGSWLGRGELETSPAAVFEAGADGPGVLTWGPGTCEAPVG